MSCQKLSCDSRIFHQSNSTEQDNCYLLQMPNELLEAIFTRIPIQDLLSLRKTTERLRCLVDDSRKLWATCTLEDLSHDQFSSPHLKKAADCGNISAIIRRALSFNFLAHEGNCPTIDEVLHELHQADLQCPSGVPFSSFFYNPPWFMLQYHSSSLLLKLKAHAETDPNCHGFDCYNVGSILFRYPEMRDQASKWFNLAAAKGVSDAAFWLWSMKYEAKPEVAVNAKDAVSSLQQIALADPRNKKVQLKLCKYYSSEHYGTLNKKLAVAYVRRFFSSSDSCVPAHSAKHNSYIPECVRKITVNMATCVITDNSWGEVILHQSMKLFNKCFRAHSIPEHCRPHLVIAILIVLIRTNWEYVHPSSLSNCMPLFSHLGDNLYDIHFSIYLFSMIFEVTKGNLEIFTIIDYLDVILEMQNECEEVQLLSYYISNLSLMSDKLSNFSDAEIAISSYVLSRAMHLRARYGDQSSGFIGTQSDIIPEKVAELTGISFNSAVTCLTLLNNECKRILQATTWDLESLLTDWFEKSHSLIKFLSLPELLEYFNIYTNEYLQ